MAYNESGHAKNVANFNELMVVLGTLGKEYNPASPAIQLDSLRDLQKKLQIALQNVNDANGVYRDKIYARQNAYDQMSTLAMRIVNTMVGLGLDAKLLAQAKSLLSKVRGNSNRRKSTESTPNSTEPKTVSISQMSFDQRKNNFSTLVGLANAQANYTPNEEDMKIESLKKYVESLQELNQEATVAEQNLSIARKDRDALLYTEGTGAISLAQQIKAYIKGALGTKHSAHERIKGIRLSGTKI